MEENPYKASAIAITADDGHESIRDAAIFGAKRGAMIVGGVFILLVLFQLGLIVFYTFTNPAMVTAMREGRTASREILDGCGTILGFSAIGALSGAAWCAPKEWVRRRRMGPTPVEGAETATDQGPAG